MKTFAPLRLPDRSPAFRRSLAGKGIALLALLTAGNILTAPSSTQAQYTATAAPIYTFTTALQPVDGSSPSGGLVKAPDGNLYGTSSSPSGYGQVYRLTPAGQFSVVYQFYGGNGGLNPSHLIVGSDGNLYGTAAAGGPSNDGLLFKLTTGGAFTVLHQFNSAIDGSQPNSLVQTSDGTIYGTAYSGGAGPNSSGYGTLYSITPTGRVTVLHTFTYGGDIYPTTLIAGSDGNLYGTTYGQFIWYNFGGTTTPGSVFRFAPASGTYTTVGQFPLDRNLGPISLIQARDGNFYGVTAAQNFFHVYTNGLVFRVTPGGTFTNLHTFNVTDGYAPVGLTEGSDGNLYGVTSAGGLHHSAPPYQTSNGDGTAFQITPAGVFTSLHSFASGVDGLSPSSPLLELGDGSFLGTTSGGGEPSDSNGGLIPSDGTPHGYGVVYKLTLVRHPDFFTGQAPLSDSVYYLSFANGNYFGYYGFLQDPNYLYHFDLGYEYIVDANDGQGDIYLYDFASGGFFYTGPNFPFPYLYDFKLGSVVYYFPNPDYDGRYNLYGTRYFYNFSTHQIVTK